MEEKKRKGYKTAEQQAEATKRYLANPEAKEKRKITSLRNSGKSFIRNYATLKDLEEYKILISEREKELKNK